MWDKTEKVSLQEASLSEKLWDEKALIAAKNHPIKGLNTLPNMVGITPETAKNLKWKSLGWMILKDHQLKILRSFLHHPIKYGLKFIRSALKNKPFKRDGDFFLYGVESVDQFADLITRKDSLFVVGFSYCHKPFECPSGRFTTECIRNFDNPVCQQCFIGKCLYTLPKENVIPLFITTIHYIGAQIFDIVHLNPKKEVLFLITACEMTLEMFGDFGNMVGIRGVGVRLDGRICNTMKAFKLSEEGIKPGLTVVLEPTKERILNLIRQRIAD